MAAAKPRRKQPPKTVRTPETSDGTKSVREERLFRGLKAPMMLCRNMDSRVQGAHHCGGRRSWWSTRLGRRTSRPDQGHGSPPNILKERSSAGLSFRSALRTSEDLLLRLGLPHLHPRLTDEASAASPWKHQPTHDGSLRFDPTARRACPNRHAVVVGVAKFKLVGHMIERSDLGSEPRSLHSPDPAPSDVPPLAPPLGSTLTKTTTVCCSQAR